MSSGLRVLDPVLDSILQRPHSSVRLLTTDYLGVTEKSALLTLLRRQHEYSAKFHVRVFQAGYTSFHPKAYILTDSADSGHGGIFVGSANASQHGLVDGHEWTLESQSPAAVTQALSRFDALWNDRRSVELTAELIESYVEAVRPTSIQLTGAQSQSVDSGPQPAIEISTVALEPPSQPVAPTDIQREALDALETSRTLGYRAGLVVMATGLGKTWLAAFDSSRPGFRRVLFVAHREEILAQASTVFRQVKPDASVGWIGGGNDSRNAEIVMASVQTLATRINEFDSGSFDYVIIDEFHHASAPSYRKVINRLEPKFLLGITATPQRSDRADLLALCEDNLVFECALAEGIGRGKLSPFHYHGVPDPIDFRPLPWRSGRFDPTELENALVTANRSEAAFREWESLHGARTLAFCVSQRHADWMSEFFAKRGIRTASVHTGPTSAPREQTLTDLRNGTIDIVFSVDLFNEGTDIPEIDTVLLLRPTQSPVLFMQQIGRGLRKAADKDSLTVIDFVGNHRSFLTPLRIMSGLVGAAMGEANLRDALETDTIALPDGCSIDYQLEAKKTILNLLPTSMSSTAVSFAKMWNDERGKRPTALESYLAGINPTATRPSWFGALADQGLLTADESRVRARHRELLDDVATTSMTKSFKIVTIRSLIVTGTLATGNPVAHVAAASRQLMLRDPRLRADVSAKAVGDLETVSEAQWLSYWNKFPLTHLQTGGQFVVQDDVLRLTNPPQPDDVATLESMISELCDWRLASYLDRHTKGLTLLRVSHSDGSPILRFDRTRHPNIPLGRDTPVRIGNDTVLMDFVKIAVNIARKTPDGPNILADLLREWFGSDAGLPGTNFHVELHKEQDEWVMIPYEPEDPGGTLRVAN